MKVTTDGGFDIDDDEDTAQNDAETDCEENGYQSGTDVESRSSDKDEDKDFYSGNSDVMEVPRDPVLFGHPPPEGQRQSARLSKQTVPRPLYNTRIHPQDFNLPVSRRNAKLKLEADKKTAKSEAKTKRKLDVRDTTGDTNKPSRKGKPSGLGWRPSSGQEARSQVSVTAEEGTDGEQDNSEPSEIAESRSTSPDGTEIISQASQKRRKATIPILGELSKIASSQSHNKTQSINRVVRHSSGTSVHKQTPNTLIQSGQSLDSETAKPAEEEDLPAQFVEPTQCVVLISPCGGGFQDADTSLPGHSVSDLLDEMERSVQ